MAPSPPITLDLRWEGALRFAARSDGVALVLDGARAAGPTPVQALAAALAGCMAMDVVQILVKGRAGLEGLGVRLAGARRSEEPRSFERIELHFVVTGPVAPEKVERALALSREKYCSVWHSMRQDIQLATSFEIERQPDTGAAGTGGPR
jgi:putative redox protein